MVDVPLRVAVVTPPFYEIPPKGYGGIEALCHVLVEGLVRRGHEVTLIAVGQDHSAARFIPTRSGECPEGQESDTLFEVTHAARAAAILSDLRPDVVHDHTRAGPLTARSRREPTVVTVHAPLAGPESHIDYWQAIDPWVWLVAVSAAQRQSAPTLNWVATIHHGIPVERYSLASTKDDYVLYLGRLSPYKGVELAIEAARAADRRIVIAGKWTTPSEQSYFDEVVHPLLGPRVEWVGEVGGDAKLDLLRRAACLLFPAQWQEPFGLVVVEAMASGTPVVALRAGSVPELIVNDVNGVICDRAVELPGGIARASHIDPLRCRQEAVQRFGADRMVAAYEDVYYQLVLAGAPAAGLSNRRRGGGASPGQTTVSTVPPTSLVKEVPPPRLPPNYPAGGRRDGPRASR